MDLRLEVIEEFAFIGSNVWAKLGVSQEKLKEYISKRVNFRKLCKIKGCYKRTNESLLKFLGYLVDIMNAESLDNKQK